MNTPAEGRPLSLAVREDCPHCTEFPSLPRQGCPLCDGKGYIEPPLTCAYCFARRWNDETVSWLPLRGLYREPYCADTCAVWVLTPPSDGAVVWAALVDQPKRGDL